MFHSAAIHVFALWSVMEIRLLKNAEMIFIGSEKNKQLHTLHSIVWSQTLKILDYLVCSV